MIVVVGTKSGELGAPGLLGFCPEDGHGIDFMVQALGPIFGSGDWKLHASVGHVDNLNDCRWQMWGTWRGVSEPWCPTHWIGVGEQVFAFTYIIYLHHHSPTHLCHPSPFISLSYVSSLYMISHPPSIYPFTHPYTHPFVNP